MIDPGSRSFINMIKYLFAWPLKIGNMRPAMVTDGVHIRNIILYDGLDIMQMHFCRHLSYVCLVAYELAYYSKIIAATIPKALID